jgi:hypothetical protein
MGRSGTFPDGISGFSATTTSCNTGDVIVPWNAPMAETHPFIGLAMFRLQDGIFEMIGKNWIKHGYFALSMDHCELGCIPSNGTYLGIGCSDTYSVSHNANRYYLGPREEIDPFTGEWEACGSFFDAEPVDCLRDYFGVEADGAAHRLAVHDSDLGRVNVDSSWAQYFYEGVYYVADDEIPTNNIGWRECRTIWNEGVWLTPTVGGHTTPTLGPVVLTWGDEQDVQPGALDDGEVALASQVTDLGGGTWHYEYALYNWRSARGIRSFEVPVGAAIVANVGFHDPDQDALNDWTATTANGWVSWSTEDFVTNPQAPALEYQTMFNFRFDADAAPVPSSVRAGIFRPGVGTAVFLGAPAPHAGATAVAAVENDTPELGPVEPNPFSAAARLEVSLERSAAVRLTVLDVTGRTVRVLLADMAPAGKSIIHWDGRDTRGARASNGVYFFRLETPAGSRTVKGTHLR